MTTIYFYKIVNTIDDMIYIGSTNDTDNRWRQHRQMDGDTNIYNHMRKYGLDKFSLIIIESKIVNNRDEQMQYEREVTDRFDPSIILNNIRAYTTVDERNEQNRQSRAKIKQDPILYEKERKVRRARYANIKQNPILNEKELKAQRAAYNRRKEEDPVKHEFRLQQMRDAHHRRKLNKQKQN